MSNIKKLPAPPYSLTKEERAFYDAIGKLVLESGKFEKGDAYCLALLAHAEALAVRLRREIARDDLTTEAAHGGIKANPKFRQLESTSAEIRLLLQQLGLTPASRNRAAAASTKNARDELSEFVA
jgi:P27 family predicted phage terminase small subunit